jgi:hypothetical protein
MPASNKPSNGAPPAPLSRIIVNANKRPVTAWKKYQERPATPEELEAMRRHPNAHSEGIVCGPVSGGLEVIDIDTKNDPAGTIHADYFAEIDPALFSRLYIVGTRSGGAHVYYRCAQPEGNQKLAHRPATAADVNSPPGHPIYTIETRGAGGYVVAPPSPGYSVIQGSEAEIPFLTDAERAELLNLARSFSVWQPEPEPLPQRTPSGGTLDTLSCFRDYSEQATAGTIRELLEAAGWKFVHSRGPKDFYLRPGKTDSVTSGDWHNGLRLFGVFSTNAHPFEPGKGYSPAAVLNALQFAGDWKATAAHLRRLGYGQQIQGERLKGTQRAAAMIRANKSESKILATLQSEGLAENEEGARELLEAAQSLAESENGDFWQFTQAGGVKIVYPAFYTLLQSWGFHRLKDTPGVYIQTEGKVLREVDPGKMAAAVFRYLHQVQAPAEVENQFRKQAPQLLAAGALAVNLAELEATALRDTPEAKYLPFLNGLAVMDQAGAVTVIPYNEAPAHIWEPHIIPRTFDPDGDFIINPAEAEFYRFLQCIAGEANHSPTEATPRTDYALRVFGYLCDTRKDKARPWAVVLSEETADDNKGGGTGKGLFMHGVNQAAPVCLIPGKEWNPDARFTYSRVTAATRCVFLDDVNKRFNLEALNNAITEGLRVERKGKDERLFAYHEAPKFAVSTNYAVDLEAEHAARRARVLEFAPYFGRHRTPADYFGHLLFDDWDQHEWNRFYNLVFCAVWQYRRHGEGLEVKPPSEAHQLKAARIKYGRDFVQWIEESREELAGTTADKSTLYGKFLTDSGTDQKQYSAHRFYKAMEQAAGELGLPLTTIRSGSGPRQYRFLKPGEGL